MKPLQSYGSHALSRQYDVPFMNLNMMLLMSIISLFQYQCSNVILHNFNGYFSGLVQDCNIPCGIVIKE